jgi:oligoendopeptidase F
MSTFAHDWGHAIHSLLAKSGQPCELADYATFIAEFELKSHELAEAGEGVSDYPVATLQKAGLDMTGPAPYRQMVAGFGGTIDKIEALL